MEKPFWMICITHMLLELYLLIQVALIPVYIREFQLSILEASLVATIPSLVQLLMNVPFGFLVDRFQVKHLLSASMLIEGAAALLLSQSNSFWMIVFGVAMMKLSSPLYHISGLSQISRIVKPEKMSRSIGIHNALGSLGVAIGSVSLAIFLTGPGWRSTYLFWAVPVLLWGAIVLRSPELGTKPVQRREAESGNALNRLSLILRLNFILFLVAVALREVGATGISTFMTTYLVKIRGLSEATSSLIFGLGPFMGILGALSGGYLGEKMGAKRTLSLVILGCAASLYMLSLTDQIYLLALIYLLYAFFSHSVWTPMNTIVSDITPRTDRGLSFSVYFFTEGTVAAFAPTAAAAVIELSDVSYILPFSIVFIVAGLGALQLFAYPRKLTPKGKT
jgi:predicted MFS family arabinose efflux permease